MVTEMVRKMAAVGMGSEYVHLWWLKYHQTTPNILQKISRMSEYWTTFWQSLRLLSHLFVNCYQHLMEKRIKALQKVQKYMYSKSKISPKNKVTSSQLSSR